MRKAASHKVGYITVLIFVAVIVLFASVTRAAAYTADPNENFGDQDINDGVIGFITIDGTQAKATVENIGDATESGGLASYTKTEGDTDGQTLYSSVSYTLEPHSKKDLSVDLPCWAQIDLFKGETLQSFADNARYGSRLVAAKHTLNECPSASAQPSPSVTPSETPAQGGANPTPTESPTPASTTTPSSSNNTSNTSSSSSSEAVLGVTTLAAAELPSTGSANYDFVVFAAYVLMIGVGLRKYANSL